MKKFLLFSFLLLIGAFSSVTWGAQETINGVTWTVDASGRITTCTGASGAVVIPNTVGGVTVTGFYYFTSFKNNSSITSIDFSSATSVHSLNAEFCQGATELTSVNFGSNITSIGNYAFDGCSKLTSAPLPDCVTSIGAVAFRNCPLTYIRIPENLGSLDFGAFTGCNAIVTVDWNANKDVPINAFNGKTTLETINFGDNCNIAILKNAFTGCKKLQTVNFGNAVITSIGDYAFDGDTSLTAAMLPNTVTYIGTVAFRNCTHLKSVRVPSGVPSMDFSSVFYNDSQIETIIWNASIDIPNSKFQNNTQLVSFSSENDATYAIGNYAFYGCSNLVTADISPNATLGNYSFTNCTKLQRITVPLGNAIFSTGCFSGCTSINTINWYANFDFPANEFSSSKTTLATVNFRNTNYISICNSAFSGYKSLVNVDFGNHLSVIGDYAFDGCDKLSSAILPDGLTAIGSVAFRNCFALDSLRIPCSLCTLNTTAFANVSSFEYVEWNSNTLSPFSFSAKPKLKTVVFGNETDLAIIDGTFYNCPLLANVDLGKHISSIGSGAFRSTAITEIDIPGSVQSIGDYAFRNCQNLSSVTFMQTNAPSFGSYTFSDFTISRKYNIPCGSYSSYTSTANTPCNAANTIEDCRGSDQPTYTIGTVTVDHDMVCNLAEINRSMYTSDAQITVSGNYKLDANALKINWEFDAQHFYYFTLPFDCYVDDIFMSDENVKNHYITDWAAAVKDHDYDFGGFQILEFDEPKYVGGTSGNKVYTGVEETRLLKAGVAYVFALLNPTNKTGADFKVTATFNKADSYSFNNNIEVNAPSVKTGDITEKSGQNLYGNPFYWNIPISNFGVQSANVIIPATNESYATVQNRTGDQSLAPGEILFVQRSDNTGITFTSNPGSAQAPAQYSNQRPIRLNLSHNGTADDYTYIKSDVEADDHYVVGEDCCKMKNAGKNQIYTMVNDTIETAFNCLNLEGSVRTIPVGLTTVNSGTFQIAVADGTKFMPGTIIKLRDTQNGAEYNLLNGPASITLGKGITDGRYVIDIMDIPCGNETIAEESTLSAFVRDGQIVVEGVDADAVVKVYDAAGRLVTSFTANADVVSFAPVASGVYFVNVSGQTIKIVY